VKIQSHKTNHLQLKKPALVKNRMQKTHKLQAI